MEYQVAEYAGAEYEGARVATRRHRRWGRILFVLGLVVVVLLVAADRFGAYAAERVLASKARSQLADQGVTLSGDPSVSIAGIPFLTQVVSGRYDEIDITVTNPAAQGIRLDTLTVTATGVTAPMQLLLSGHGTVEADKVVGTGVISWTAFKQMVDLSGLQNYGIDPATLNIASTDAGNITITTPVTVAGQTVNARATGTMTVQNDVVHVAISNVTSDGGGLAGIAVQMAGIQKQLTFDVRIPPLPFDMVLDSVTATSAGVNLVAHADHVTLGR